MYSHGTCQCSWGGVKESGIGRAHSKFGFYECVNIKHVGWEPSTFRDFWWHPYDESLTKALRASAKLLYGRRKQRLEALRTGAGPLAQLARRTLDR
jgi:succinate-semialdehyde dehydrogenase/glutarate-semialdehyde dehydrogenase